MTDKTYTAYGSVYGLGVYEVIGSSYGPTASYQYLKTGHYEEVDTLLNNSKGIGRGQGSGFGQGCGKPKFKYRRTFF